MVSDLHLNDVESSLEARHPSRWRRLTPQEMRGDASRYFQAGWRIDLQPGSVRTPGLHFLWLLVDRSFPNSQPRVVVPELGGRLEWPHVEPPGVLCLPPSSIEAPTQDRIGVQLDDAIQLFNLSDDACQAEFQREFGSYWSQRASREESKLRVLSMVKPAGQSRAIMFYVASNQRRIFAADDRVTLGAWLRNAGASIGHQQMQPGLLVRLPRPWLPKEFPTTIAQAIHGLPDDVVRPVLLQRPRSLILFEASTETGPVFAAVVANGDKLPKLQHGFRSLAQVPMQNIRRALAQQSVERVVVSRVDPAWVLGRDHSPDLKSLQARKVAIIGCGSVGSELAALLAKAGVGELALVDHDDLNSSNLGRHLLGAQHLGHNKAQAVAEELRRRLPHLRAEFVCPKRFEALTVPELDNLATVDLIITAGLDIEGEAVVNAWRQTLDRPPAYVSTWVEAYCSAGHAVLLYGRADLMTRFERERPSFRLTDWPPEAHHLIVEAGCGNQFQPYGAADLLPTISMATSLVLDALTGRALDSCRRTWFGDRDAVSALGGIARETFTEQNAMRSFAW